MASIKRILILEHYEPFDADESRAFKLANIRVSEFNLSSDINTIFPKQIRIYKDELSDIVMRKRDYRLAGPVKSWDFKTKVEDVLYSW